MLLTTKLDVQRIDAARIETIESLENRITELTANLGTPLSDEFNTNVATLSELTTNVQTLKSEVSNDADLKDGELTSIEYADSLSGRRFVIDTLTGEIKDVIAKTERGIAKRKSRVDTLTAYAADTENGEERIKRATELRDTLQGQIDVLDAALTEYKDALPTTTAKRASGTTRRRNNGKKGTPLSGPQTITVNHQKYEIDAATVEKLKETYNDSKSVQNAVNIHLIDTNIIDDADSSNHAWNAVARIVGHLTPKQQAKIDAENAAKNADADSAKTDNDANDNADNANDNDANDNANAA